MHNWGWAIVGLVVLLRIAMYPLSAAQYKSAAKMRKFQPRLQQLKERYGEDRQKFQQAMMELYKKEKINPMGGCFPILIQMPIFFALYWVLVKSVELRQAPWLGWIQDLTTRDPYFILPLLNIVIMWATQKLTPTPAGMDPHRWKNDAGDAVDFWCDDGFCALRFSIVLGDQWWFKFVNPMVDDSSICRFFT